MTDIYAVQALIPDPGTLAPSWARGEWRDVFVADGDSTGIENLNAARRERSIAKRFYVNVRIVRRPDTGKDVIVG